MSYPVPGGYSGQVSFLFSVDINQVYVCRPADTVAATATIPHTPQGLQPPLKFATVQHWIHNQNFNFFNPTDTTRVANSPRLGVGPGFDSQGCVTFLSQILLSQLVLNPLGYPG